MGQTASGRVRPSATSRNNARSGQLDADARDVLDHARTDLDQALSDRRERAGSRRARHASASGMRGVPDWRSRYKTTVWSGRALQVDFAEKVVSGLASM
jgi:hypothetical protein